MGAWEVDLSSVESLEGEIRRDLYPSVSGVPPACAFVIRLCRFSRRPKTIDAYARNLDRFLAWFGDAPLSDGWKLMRAISWLISTTCATAEYQAPVLSPSRAAAKRLPTFRYAYR